MKISEIRDLSEQESKERLRVLKKSLFEMRTQKTIGRIEKPSKIKQTRRDIARILTVLKEKARD